MSTEFPHPRYQYYLIELDQHGVPKDLVHQPGSNIRGDAIKAAQELIMSRDNDRVYYRGIAIVEILEVVTSIREVTTYIESPRHPDPPDPEEQDD